MFFSTFQPIDNNMDKLCNNNNVCSLFFFVMFYSHPWETVAQAAWRKYPNPMNPAVIGTDVVERQVVNGVLHTSRLVSSTWYFPKWAQAVSDLHICVHRYMIYIYIIYSSRTYWNISIWAISKHELWPSINQFLWFDVKVHIKSI